MTTQSSYALLSQGLVGLSTSWSTKPIPVLPIQELWLARTARPMPRTSSAVGPMLLLLITAPPFPPLACSMKAKADAQKAVNEGESQVSALMGSTC